MMEPIIETIMEGLMPVIGILIIIGIILMVTGAAIFYILTIVEAFEYHWLFGCAIAILLLLAYVLVASFLVGLFLL